MTKKTNEPAAYAFTARGSYSAAGTDDLTQHIDRVREKVLPDIKVKMRKKEAEAQVVRARKIF